MDKRVAITDPYYKKGSKYKGLPKYMDEKLVSSCWAGEGAGGVGVCRYQPKPNQTGVGVSRGEGWLEGLAGEGWGHAGFQPASHS